METRTFDIERGEKKTETVREKLKEWVKDTSLSAILIGEHHMSNITDAFLLANSDILRESNRPIVLVFEAYAQFENELLKKSTLEANPLYLKQLRGLENTTFSVLLSSYGLITQGLTIVGAEDQESNPFLGKNVEENDNLLFEQIKYGKSPERITVPNAVFAKLINELIMEGNLVIFVGGAIHNIELKNGAELFDPGIQGRIEDKSISLNLVVSSNNGIALNASYVPEDHQQYIGNYQFEAQTDDLYLYLDSFNDQATLEDKAQLLYFYLLTIFKTYDSFGHNPSSLNYKVDPVIKGFKKSLNENLNLDAINLFKSTFLAEKEESEKRKKSSQNSSPSFFSTIFSYWNPNAKSQETLEKKLQKAIINDLKLNPDLTFNLPQKDHKQHPSPRQKF